jgi:hypothetical protein
MFKIQRERSEHIDCVELKVGNAELKVRVIRVIRGFWGRSRFLLNRAMARLYSSMASCIYLQ